MDYDHQSNKIRVVESQWKKILQQFPGAVAIPKYGQWLIKNLNSYLIVQVLCIINLYENYLINCSFS